MLEIVVYYVHKGEFARRLNITKQTKVADRRERTLENVFIGKKPLEIYFKEEAN